MTYQHGAYVHTAANTLYEVLYLESMKMIGTRAWVRWAHFLQNQKTNSGNPQSTIRLEVYMLYQLVEPKNFLTLF